MTKRPMPSKKKFWGQVLWWDERDGQGVIKDWSGNRLYFDVSAFATKETRARIGVGRFVQFHINEAITDALCACRVIAPAYPIEKEVA